MANDNDNVISTLNNLIETCKDGENGFRAAADGVKDSELEDALSIPTRSSARSSPPSCRVKSASSAATRKQTGSVAATLHRGWINIKSAVTGEDEGAVISECERGEDSAVKNYQSALEETCPPTSREIVERSSRRSKRRTTASAPWRTRRRAG